MRPRPGLSKWCVDDDHVKKCNHSLCINYFCIAATKIPAPNNLRWEKFVIALDFISFYHAGKAWWQKHVAETVYIMLDQQVKKRIADACPTFSFLPFYLVWVPSWDGVTHILKWYSCFQLMETLLQACPEVCLNLWGSSTIHQADSVL